jgi:hypothetical protein
MISDSQARSSSAPASAAAAAHLDCHFFVMFYNYYVVVSNLIQFIILDPFSMFPFLLYMLLDSHSFLFLAASSSKSFLLVVWWLNIFLTQLLLILYVK